MPTSKLTRAWTVLRQRGTAESYRLLRKRLRRATGRSRNDTRILLITNRDSDNVGDQVIEECAIALIKTALANLGIVDYTLTSRAAGMISRRYLATKDPALLEEPERAIAKSNVIVFGGAPLFNFRYQPFYERTAITVEMAERYGKPVLFSSIGIEGYDEESEKCQRLKTALNLPCVKQITTRDNYAALERFAHRDDLAIAKVADPAVFAQSVFRNFVSEGDGKIGLFVIREHAFRDNDITFEKKAAVDLWLSLIRELSRRGYDYELISSGHFSDEAFMELLISDYGIPASKCVFNMNAPEDLVGKIASYRAIVSCRLHPSIIAYSLDVPSVGIVWNDKVPQFYASVGYEDRTVTIEKASAGLVVDKIEQSIAEGVDHDTDLMASVYTSLYEGLRRLLKPETASSPLPYPALLDKLPPFSGTTPREREAKLERKFRRTYLKFNTVTEQNAKLKERNAKLVAKCN